MELVDFLSQIHVVGHFDPPPSRKSFIFNKALVREPAEWRLVMSMDLFSMA